MEKLQELGKSFMKLSTEKSYWQQDMVWKDRLKMVGIAAFITGLTGWLYYQSVLGIILLIPVGIWLYRLLEKQYEEKQKSKFLLAFKEMIQNLASSLNTGYSIENAMKEARKEMLLLYKEEELIIREMSWMVREIQIQIPAENVMEEFARRCNLEDVRNFAAVFVTAKRTGGDMIAIIRNTSDQIGEKIDVKREVDTILAAKRYEFMVMSAIPYFIIAYMQLSFPEFMKVLYHNLLGIGVMTVCLGIYAAAFALGMYMIKIEV